MQPTCLRFGAYSLDLERGCLFHAGSEVTLRPKTFAVLRYLVQNAGRLVSKDELFAAVWPDVAVSDDALVQSVGELRRALGDDGPDLIKTIPRRGYRFEAAVSAGDSAQRGAGSPALPARTVPRTRIGILAAIAGMLVLLAGALWFAVPHSISPAGESAGGAPKPAIA